LSQTVREFAPREEVSDWMRLAGMVDVRFESLTGGIAVLHRGIVD
jgi:ubiquinone/menaquinone biosynthesis C-methylase UbiE